MIKTIQEVTFETKNKKDGTGKFNVYTVLFDDGSKADTFDKEIAMVRGMVDVDIVPNGKFTPKLKSWVLAGPATNAPATKPADIRNPPIPTKTTPLPVSRDDNINAAVAVKEIGECLRAKIEIPAGLTELYWNWIKHSLGAAIPKQSAPEPEDIPF